MFFALRVLAYSFAVLVSGEAASIAQTTIRPHAHRDVQNFSDPGNAWDDGEGTFTGAGLNRVCNSACTNGLIGQATFDTFPAGYTPSLIRIDWFAYATFSVFSGNAGTVTAKLEYDLGGGWETLELPGSFRQEHHMC
jgi:hypothetical protein